MINVKRRFVALFEFMGNLPQQSEMVFQICIKDKSTVRERMKRTGVIEWKELKPKANKHLEL